MALSASTDSIQTVSTATSSARPGGPILAGPLLRTQPDDRLAALAGEGSKPAFDELVRRYRGALVGYASRMAPSNRADDVVQDATVKAFLALRRGDRPELPKAWLFKIVRNTALNDQRDWKQYEHLDENYDGVEQPPQAAERRRQLKDLIVALGDLPEAQRQAIVQRELEGKGHDEIARDLDVSPGAVRQLIFRARNALRAGVGALVPMQLLRWVAMAGADPAAPVAAGAGIGLGAAKVGLGAVLATGAVVVGAQVTKDVKDKDTSSAASAQQGVAGETASSSQAGDVPGGSQRGDRGPAALRKKAQTIVKPTAAKPPPPPPRHAGQLGARHQPPPGGQQSGGGYGGGGGAGGHHGGGGAGGGGGTQQPPPGGGGLQFPPLPAP
jgi:RNA polymerase sigma factor (sigma-70 family)